MYEQNMDKTITKPMGRRKLTRNNSRKLIRKSQEGVRSSHIKTLAKTEDLAETVRDPGLTQIRRIKQAKP